MGIYFQSQFYISSMQGVSMTKVFVGLVVLLFFYSHVIAQDNLWNIDLEDGGHITHVSFVALEDDSLTITHKGESSKISIESIRRISNSRGTSNIVANLVTGTLVGAGAGFTLGLAMDVRENPLKPYDDDNKTKVSTAAAGGVLGLTIASIAALDREGMNRSIELEQLELEERRSAVSSLFNSAEISTRLSYGFRPGVSIPTGDFGKTSGDDPGAAQLGFSLVGELNYALTNEINLTSSLVLTFNNVDKDAVDDSARRVFPSGKTDVSSWFCVWTMTGLQIRRALTPDFSPYLDIQVGILLGSSPTLNIQNYFNVLSSTATGFAIGIGGGFLIKEKLKLHAQYLYSEPEYNLKTTDGGWSESRRQQTGLVLITAGWML
jgi:opacity protein-like surface antigen